MAARRDRHPTDTQRLTAEIQRARARTTRSLDRLRSRLRPATAWRRTLDRHPWTAVTAAVAAGIILFPALARRRGRQRVGRLALGAAGLLRGSLARFLVRRLAIAAERQLRRNP